MENTGINKETEEALNPASGVNDDLDPVVDEHVEVEHLNDFHAYPKEELVKTLESFCEEPDYASIRAKIISLKDVFHETINHEKENKLQLFIESGGEKEKFIPESDPLEIRFYEAAKKLNRKRIEYIESQEKQREENLKHKREILQELKNLIQNEENMSRAFNTFHELQVKWRSIGAIPQKDANDLWMTYRHFTDQFYNYIKLNRELQDLDYKKNLEMKISICEQIEELLLEPSINKALNNLMVLQNSYKEIGAVPRERRTEIGERFKSASDKIYERKAEHIENIKSKQKENLRLKNELCDKAKEIISTTATTHNDFQEKSKLLEELQKEWRTVGQATKNQNEAVWKKFRSVYDEFFKGKNEFYHNKKKEYQANLQAKTELCVRAESLVNSMQWKSAASELRKLHDDWKKIGPVGSKMSDKIWNRFKAASDAFHSNRKSHFVDVEKEFEENLKKKTELIDRINNFKMGENRDENFNSIREMQRAWSEIGMVSLDKKDEIYEQYKRSIDTLFDQLRISEKEKQALRYKDKIDHLRSSPHAREKISDEKKSLLSKISFLNNEVTTWENNLGFFAKSKNADQIKQEFEGKIKRAKEDISKLRQQLNMIKGM